MRLSMTSRIIQTEVNVICRITLIEADNIDRGLNNSWCHAEAESNNCFITHLNTSETYKTIKRSLLMFQVYYFIFARFWVWVVGRAGDWAQQRPIIFFGCKFDPKSYYWNKYRILRIIRSSLTNQEREYILNV